MTQQYMQQPPPSAFAHPPVAPERRKGSGLAVTSLVLGIIGLFLSWIPIVNYLAVILGVLGLVLGIIGIFKSTRVMSIIGAVLSLLAIILSFVFMASFVNAVDEAVTDLDASLSGIPAAESDLGTAIDAGTATTEAAPAPDADPLSDGVWTLSDVLVDSDNFGTALTARVQNTDAVSRSGLLTLTVFDANGTMIGQTTGAANDVEAGSTATVTFMGDGDGLAGDPSTFTYELQDSGSY